MVKIAFRIDLLMGSAVTILMLSEEETHARLCIRGSAGIQGLPTSGLRQFTQFVDEHCKT